MSCTGQIIIFKMNGRERAPLVFKVTPLSRNLIDLATFITLFVVIITHFVDVSIRDSTHVIGTIHVRLVSHTLI